MHKQHKILLPVLVACFMFMSIFFGDIGKTEIFPFFNWKLFYYIPKIKRDYGVLITKIDNKEIKPIYYEALDSKFKNSSQHFYKEYFIRIGRSFKQGEAVKQELRNLFNPEHSFSISLTERQFNGLERLKQRDQFYPESFKTNTILEAYELN